MVGPRLLLVAQGGVKVSRCAVVRRTGKRYTAGIRRDTLLKTTFILGYLQGDRICL